MEIVDTQANTSYFPESNFRLHNDMKKIIGVFKINQHIYTHEIKKKAEEDDQHGDICLALDDEDE